MSSSKPASKPLHVTVTEDLRRRILSGEFSIGTKMPSLRSLTSEYDVSEVTAHTAIRALQAEGILESASGSGTFVKAFPSGAEDRPLADQVAALRTEVKDLTARLERLESHEEKSTGVDH